MTKELDLLFIAEINLPFYSIPTFLSIDTLIWCSVHEILSVRLYSSLLVFGITFCSMFETLSRNTLSRIPRVFFLIFLQTFHIFVNLARALLGIPIHRLLSLSSFPSLVMCIFSSVRHRHKFSRQFPRPMNSNYGAHDLVLD